MIDNVLRQRLDQELLNSPKIYIAGAITGYYGYKKVFKDMELELKSRGFVAFNPVKPKGFTYKSYIDMGLCELMRCDAILVLPGWENSKGASLEVQYAKTVGLPVFTSVQELEDCYTEQKYGNKR